MKVTLTRNLSTGTVREGKNDWTPPPLYFNDEITIGIRLEKNVDGSPVDLNVDMQALTAAIGEVDGRPGCVDFRLQIGLGVQTEENTTVALNYDVSATSLATAINALEWVVETYGRAEVWQMDGSWFLKFGSGAIDVPLLVRNNRVQPFAFGATFSRQIDGEWYQELRLVTAPVAVSGSAERVLPPPPSISRVQSGGSEGETFWNEIQALYMPPDFAGSYRFRRDFVRSPVLSRDDGPEQIQDALNVIGESFVVTRPRDQVAHIEFVGELEGMSHDLLELFVVDAPPGDWTVTIKLDRAELAALLRSSPEVTLPLVIRALVQDDSAPEIYRPTTLVQIPVTIRRQLFQPPAAVVENIDWQRPVSPKDYVPFDRSQVITGQQHYPFVIGDGEKTSWTVDHMLGTDELAGVTLRENISGGRLLHAGVDFDFVAVPNANSVEIVFTAAPAFDSIAGVITTAGPTSAFVAGIRVTIGQVIGLDAVLEDHGARIKELEKILPKTGAGANKTSTASMTIEIPAKDEILFWRGDSTDPEDLPRRAPYMLPAIHQADASAALPVPQPSPSTITAPTVFTNTTDKPITLMTGGKVRDRDIPAIVLPGGYAACDGRGWYPVERDGDRNSYYPTLYNRKLCFAYISEKMLRVNRTMELEFSIKLQALKADSKASWVLDLRAGSAPQDEEPNPTGLNLQNIVWEDTPILRERLIVSELATTHTFGLRIRRTATGLDLDVSEYGVWEGRSIAAPSSANFALGGDLIQFDTENSRPAARGFIRWQFFGKLSSDDESETSTQLPAIIKIT